MSKETDETIFSKGKATTGHKLALCSASPTQSLARSLALSHSPQYSTPASFRTLRKPETLPYDPKRPSSPISAPRNQSRPLAAPTITNAPLDNLKSASIVPPSFYTTVHDQRRALQIRRTSRQPAARSHYRSELFYAADADAQGRAGADYE